MLFMNVETVQFYNTHAEMLAAMYHKADMADFHRILCRWLPPRVRILEIGCGCGREALFSELTEAFERVALQRGVEHWNATLK